MQILHSFVTFIYHKMFYKEKNMFKKFCSYYKPHMKLFTLDLFCALVLSLCNLIYPLIAQYIIRELAGKENKIYLILILAVVLLGIYLIKAFLNFVIQYWGHIVGVRIQADMRKELFIHLQKLPFSYFDENKTGTIMSRLINDLMDISELAHHGPEDIFIATITLIGSCVFMILKVNPWLTIIIFSVVPVIIGYAIITRKGMRNAFKKMREETGAINAQVESSISGIRVAKAYTTEEYEVEKFEKCNIAFQKARAGAYKQMGFFGSGMTFFTDFLYLLALIVGGIFYSKRQIDEADYTTLILYVNNIIVPIRTIVNIFEQIQSGMTGFQRFMDVINTKVEDETENPLTLEGINDSICFHHVSFKYVNQDDREENNMILSNLSLDIPKGKTIALVGPSGGGKTTICHLIPRFYEIQSGSITIDGIDIRKYSRISLRKKIGIVQQDVFLFAGSIRENIAIGKIDATDEEIIEASKEANIYEYIMSLPLGFDTYVGERGIKLSGGQKQRISIARAFLKNPPILILDEATSALDNVTEMYIQASLEKLSKGRTTIIVAHRLSTVKAADKIIVMDKDGIIEEGTHEELLKCDGVYKNLYQYQFKD